MQGRGSKWAVVAVVGAAVMGAAAVGCSGSSGGPAPVRTPAHAPTPTPSFTQLGTLAISKVLDTIPFTGSECPQTLPEVRLDPGNVIACDPHPRRVYVLAKPAVGEREVEATTVAQQPGKKSWTVYLQLSPRGARAFSEIGGRYAIVYNGVVLSTSPAVTPGGLLQISGLSKHKANHIAAALNPS